MSVLDLPDPDEWRRSSRFAAAAIVACIGVALAYLGLGAAASTRGGYLTLAVTIGFSAFLILFASAVLLIMLSLDPWIDPVEVLVAGSCRAPRSWAACSCRSAQLFL